MAYSNAGPMDRAITAQDLPINRPNWSNETRYRLNFNYAQLLQRSVMDRIYDLHGLQYNGETSLPDGVSKYSFSEYIALAVYNNNFNSHAWEDTGLFILFEQQKMEGYMGQDFWATPDIDLLIIQLDMYVRFFHNSVPPPLVPNPPQALNQFGLPVLPVPDNAPAVLPHNLSGLGGSPMLFGPQEEDPAFYQQLMLNGQAKPGDYYFPWTPVPDFFGVVPPPPANPEIIPQRAHTPNNAAAPHSDGLAVNYTINPALLSKVPAAGNASASVGHSSSPPSNNESGPVQDAASSASSSGSSSISDAASKPDWAITFPEMLGAYNSHNGSGNFAPLVQPADVQEPQASPPSPVEGPKNLQQGIQAAVPAWAAPTMADHAQLGLRGTYVQSFEAAQKIIQLACDGAIRLTKEHVNDKEIVSGSVFVYKCAKKKAGKVKGEMNRWSDLHNWTASRKGKQCHRVEGSKHIKSDEFFYRELNQSKHKGAGRKPGDKSGPELDANGKRKRAKASLDFDTHMPVNMSNLRDTLHLTIDELGGRSPQKVAEEFLNNYSFDKDLKYGGLVKRTFTEIHNAGRPDECSYRVLSFYKLSDVCSNRVRPFET